MRRQTSADDHEFTQENLAQFIEKTLSNGREEANRQYPQIGTHIRNCKECKTEYDLVMALTNAQQEGTLPPIPGSQ